MAALKGFNVKLLLLKFSVSLLGLLGAKGIYYLSYPLGWLVWHVSPTKRSTTRRNLSVCYPEMADERRKILARSSMRHYTQTILEIGFSWTWSLARLQKIYDPPVGLDLLDQAHAQGKGVLLLVPHFGAWEISVHFLQTIYPVMALYKPGSSSTVEQEMLRRRQRFGTQMAATDRKGLRTIFEMLKSGGIVLQLPDQNPSVGQGRFVPFYGIPTLTGVLAPRLIQRTSCAVLMMVCKRTSAGRYQLQFLPVSHEVQSDDLEIALTAVNRGVEDCIALDPAQYLWAYKRFKSRPEGEPRFYQG